MKQEKNLSESQEDYLKQIYLLQKEKKEVRVTDIAQVLNISKPSVNRAISFLQTEGYLLHEHYGTISLTEKGSKIAENIVETHKILRKFLTEFLEVEEKLAEKEACGMEHVLSKGTRKKLRKFMKRIGKKSFGDKSCATGNRKK